MNALGDGAEVHIGESQDGGWHTTVIYPSQDNELGGIVVELSTPDGEARWRLSFVGGELTATREYTDTE